MKLIGTIYRYQGNGSLALDYYNKALRIAEVIDDKHARALLLNNIGAAS